jgi:hypothetical protein
MAESTPELIIHTSSTQAPELVVLQYCLNVDQRLAGPATRCLSEVHTSAG